MIDVDVFRSIDEIDKRSYQDLFSSCQAPAYYDPRFLRAAEFSPLISCEKSFYLVARHDANILAFMPVYLQSFNLIDPFGLLKKSIPAKPLGDQIMISHITHCCDTRIIIRRKSLSLYYAIFSRLFNLCREEGIQHFVLLNVSNESLIKAAKKFGLETNSFVDRYFIDLSSFTDFDDLVSSHLPAKGRTEARRQLRKFRESSARVVIEHPPFKNTTEVGKLCHETTAKNGTPGYLSPDSLSKFISMCGSLVRLVSIYLETERVGVGIILLDVDRVHFWLAGMNYQKCSFSPYTIVCSEVYKFAFRNNYRWVESGRLNDKIKRRLGLTPLPLYSISNLRPCSLPGLPGTDEAYINDGRRVLEGI